MLVMERDLFWNISIYDILVQRRKNCLSENDNDIISLSRRF